MARKRGQVLDGLVFLDKPEGLSSNHALQRLKHKLDAQKAGHTGTLDPFATGLLVCCLGRATKIAGHMLDADKGYLATMLFGVETDSGDLTGVQTQTAPSSFVEIDRATLEATLKTFEGVQLQIPPMTSALKRDGKPLYAYAREGIELVREPRQITIHRIELLACVGKTASVHIECTKGTYIRTLAQDIGRQLGVFAHLIALRRTRVGPFLLDQAVTLDEINEMTDAKKVIMPVESLPPELLIFVPQPIAKSDLPA
jgi:tRNA pseudouridine55 synthase